MRGNENANPYTLDTHKWSKFLSGLFLHFLSNVSVYQLSYLCSSSINSLHIPKNCLLQVANYNQLSKIPLESFEHQVVFSILQVS